MISHSLRIHETKPDHGKIGNYVNPMAGPVGSFLTAVGGVRLYCSAIEASTYIVPPGCQTKNAPTPLTSWLGGGYEDKKANGHACEGTSLGWQKYARARVRMLLGRLNCYRKVEYG